jgi:hypothetical protein
LAESL